MMNARRLYVRLGLVLLLASLLAYVGIGRVLVATSTTIANYNNATTTPSSVIEESSEDDSSRTGVMVGPYLSYRILWDYYFTTKAIKRETMKAVYAYGGVIIEEKLVNDKLHCDIKMPCDIDFDKWRQAMDASMRYDYAFKVFEIQRRIKVTNRYVADIQKCVVDQ
ncbi:hypothetical protein V1509DRAFT_77438 [Lipomyces kononenkoae]